jgi:ABC-type amino acid transport substrate-binding protein
MTLKTYIRDPAEFFHFNRHLIHPTILERATTLIEDKEELISGLREITNSYPVKFKEDAIREAQDKLDDAINDAIERLHETGVPSDLLDDIKDTLYRLTNELGGLGYESTIEHQDFFDAIARYNYE